MYISLRKDKKLFEIKRPNRNTLLGYPESNMIYNIDFRA